MVTLKKANEAKKRIALQKKWFLYDYIDKNPGLSVYDLSKKLNWPTGSVNNYIQELIKDGMIDNKTNIKNGRVRKSYSVKEVGNYLNWKEMKNIKKPEK
ncbi:MAG: winged helix-turn-helix domain-containing protein [Promethearchaeota archaeon]